MLGCNVCKSYSFIRVHWSFIIYLHVVYLRHQLLAYADDVNILGGSLHTVKEDAEALVVATKEIGLEVNADKTKYMVMSRDRNAGRDHSVKIDNTSIERVEEFKYLETTLTDPAICWHY